ncbi:hypothetical protein GCM10027422_10820 [Hymenobacter arcticus]
MNTTVFGPEVVIMLTKAGWFPGRHIDKDLELPSDVQYPAAILKLLQEYGGLKVRSTGAGITVGRNSIDFDPTWADQESSEDGKLYYYSGLIGTTLYPIGHVPLEALLLCLDKDNRVYMAGDNLYWVGNSFTEGVSNILLGISGKVLDEEEMNWE